MGGGLCYVTDAQSLLLSVSTKESAGRARATPRLRPQLRLGLANIYSKPANTYSKPEPISWHALKRIENYRCATPTTVLVMPHITNMTRYDTDYATNTTTGMYK